MVSVSRHRPVACVLVFHRNFRWGIRLWFFVLLAGQEAWVICFSLWCAFSAVSWSASSSGSRSCIISSAAVGAFFLVGVSIIAHTRAAYVVILGLTTAVKIHFTSFGLGPQYLLSAPTSWHRYLLALVTMTLKCAFQVSLESILF